MVSDNRCLICNSPVRVEEPPDKLYKVNCPRCGKYEITDEAFTMFERSSLEDKVLSISYWIRQHQSEKGSVLIDSNRMRNLLVPFVSPKPKEQADRLLLWIGSNFPKPNDEINFKQENLISLIGAYNSNGVAYIIIFLKDEGVFSSANFLSNDGGTFEGVLSFKGWDRYDELQRSNKDSRLAFMAMQYDNSVLQQIFSNVIVDAVKQTGFEIRKLDDVKRAGLIDDKLRVEIRRSKFAITDLTDENRGAYWEAGFAEGLGMPVIYICEESKFNDKSKTTHFDTNHHLTVSWKNDNDGLKKFAEELKDTIRATLPSEAKLQD